ncbi:MAG TPA: hypothetical protein H9867_05795 [Candidatus Corynebacterium gallistercoris]|uniref:PE family protein n=1 Tax=Candidatus Corynebacterium gallistercoris TaxID=2838530 RepID=A0A9D1UQJ6_9CORY|nr:hypothetical protein [Candidatus Corynebacterium gallistercoris]
MTIFTTDTSDLSDLASRTESIAWAAGAHRTPVAVTGAVSPASARFAAAVASAREAQLAALGASSSFFGDATTAITSLRHAVDSHESAYSRVFGSHGAGVA